MTKNNLRAVKKQYALFEQMVEDTKDLIDIPEYWPQMKRLGLPLLTKIFSFYVTVPSPKLVVTIRD